MLRYIFLFGLANKLNFSHSITGIVTISFSVVIEFFLVGEKKIKKESYSIVFIKQFGKKF
jgi:hypothetical protein